MKDKSKQKKTPATLHEEAAIGFVGFTIFDIIHFTVAAITLVFAYVKRPILEMEAAASSVELCFVVLLTMFEVSLVKKIKNAETLRRNYGYCCLLAAMAVFIPTSFLIPELVHGDWGVKEFLPPLILTSVETVFSFLAVFFFAFAQIVDEKTEGGLSWRKLTFVGDIFFILTALAAVACIFFEEELPTWVLVFKGIGAAAPLVPGVLTFWRLGQHQDDTDLY